MNADSHRILRVVEDRLFVDRSRTLTGVEVSVDDTSLSVCFMDDDGRDRETLSFDWNDDSDLNLLSHLIQDLMVRHVATGTRGREEAFAQGESLRPPTYADQLLRFLPLDRREEVLGDLEEGFHSDIKRHGVELARRAYRVQVFYVVVTLGWRLAVNVSKIAATAWISKLLASMR